MGSNISCECNCCDKNMNCVSITDNSCAYTKAQKLIIENENTNIALLVLIVILLMFILIMWCVFLCCMKYRLSNA